jgi:hypothetical protein
LNREIKEVKRLVLFLFVLAGMAVLLGCAQVRDEDVATPWAQPEPWERDVGQGLFGI